MKRPRAPRQLIWLAVIIGVIAIIWLFQSTLTHPIDSYADCANAGNTITEGNPPICHDGNRAIRGPMTSLLPSAPVETTIPFDILVDGDSTGTYPRQQLVITTQAQWQQYWQSVHASLPALPPLLPVDFATSNVIALSEGRETTTGYSYKVTSIAATSSGTQVNVTESIPTISCKVKNTPANRYYIVRSTRLNPPVTFNTSTEHRQCP